MHVCVCVCVQCVCVWVCVQCVYVFVCVHGCVCSSVCMCVWVCVQCVCICTCVYMGVCVFVCVQMQARACCSCVYGHGERSKLSTYMRHSFSFATAHTRLWSVSSQGPSCLRLGLQTSTFMPGFYIDMGGFRDPHTWLESPLPTEPSPQRYLSLSRRTWVRFPAPIWQLPTICNCRSRRSNAFLWPP